MRILILFSVCFLFLGSLMAQDIQQLSRIGKNNLVEQILFEESAELPTQANNIYIGQEIYIPETALVEVARDIETTQRWGREILKAEEKDSCVIDEGNQLKVRGFSSDAALALVEHLNEGPPGAWCPAGAMFFIDAAELAAFGDRNKANKKRDDLVEQILFGESAELPTQANNISIGQEIYMPEFKWVRVVRDTEDPGYVTTNLSAIRNLPSDLSRKERAAFIRRNQTSEIIRAGEFCSIKAESKLKVLGSSDMLVLVENLIEGPGTFCPAGTMFFMDAAELESFSVEQI